MLNTKWEHKMKQTPRFARGRHYPVAGIWLGGDNYYSFLLILLRFRYLGRSPKATIV